MNHSERTHVIAEWLNPETGFLKRFKLPEAIGGAVREELMGLVEVVNDASPIYPNAEAMREFLAMVGKKVSATAKSRSWPLQHDFAKAIDAVRKRPAPSAAAITGEDDASRVDPLLGRKIELSHQWFQKFGQIPGWWNTEAVCVGLIKANLCTYEELKQAHANVPMRENAAHLGAAQFNPKRFGGGGA